VSTQSLGRRGGGAAQDELGLERKALVGGRALAFDLVDDQLGGRAAQAASWETDSRQ
jgi:hypothetical protein